MHMPQNDCLWLRHQHFIFLSFCRGQKGEGGVSFRGDSRWLGLARDADKDFLACMTTSHNIIFAGLSFGDIG